MAAIVAEQPNIAGFFSTLSENLCAITGCDILIYSLYDATQQTVSNHLWQRREFSTISSESSDRAMAVVQAWDTQQPILVQDVANDDRFVEVVRVARRLGVGSFCRLPLSACGQQFGALVFGSTHARAFRESDLAFLGNVARLVTLTLQNAQALGALQKQRDSLINIGETLFSKRPPDELLLAIIENIRQVVHQDFTCLLLGDEHARCLRRRPLDLEPALPIHESDERIPLEYFPYGQALLDRQTTHYSLAEINRRNATLAQRMQKLGAQSLSVVPLINRGEGCGVLTMASKRENAFVMQDEDFLQHVANQIVAAMERTPARQETQPFTESLEDEEVQLQEEKRPSHNFEGIIGDSPNLRRALGQVETVAPSNATVLILGETGTGKELVARAIHRMSSRGEGGFVKLNCAAIPGGLLESELFGHEKGAFTGALSQKVGRLELAHKGTLFLDEVGDIPLELQPKLLHVLQDQEFERLGSTRTIKVDIRLVAATNRDLRQSVAAGQFRSDLFYRLYVFPVQLPPLRERISDIPQLVRYFVHQFSQRTGKQIDTIPAEAMNALTKWYWPGNVRELENFVERSVLLSAGPVLNMPLTELRAENEGSEYESTLRNIEREHILRVLRETGGVIAGIRGAAARLGMKRTTLQSRMQRMGINRADYEN